MDDTQLMHADVAYIPKYDDCVGTPTCLGLDIGGDPKETVPLVLEKNDWFYRFTLSSSTAGNMQLTVSTLNDVLDRRPPDDLLGPQSTLHLQDCIQPDFRLSILLP